MSVRRDELPLRLLGGWRGPAVGALAAFVACLAGALVANLSVIAGVSGAGLAFSASVGLLVYGGLGVGSVGQGGGGLGELAASIHTSLSATLLGAFLLMLAALTAAGWLASRYGRPAARGTIATGAKTAVLFGLAMLAGSFVFRYLDLHPQHVRAFAFPCGFGLIFCSLGARVERDGLGSWRLSQHERGLRSPAIQGLGSGVVAVARTLALTAVATVVVLVALAVAHPHEAGQVVGGRQAIAEILLLPLWLPHAVGVLWLAAQGVAFQLGAKGGIGGTDSAFSGSVGSTLSIFGGDGTIGVPGSFALLLLIPLGGGVWGGFAAARRRAGRAGERLAAALWASIPFLLASWALDLLVGMKASLSVLGIAGEASFRPLSAGAIFWPLLWGPALYLGGALLQVWRAAGALPVVSLDD